MLGAVIGLTNVVKPESVLKVLEHRIPKGFLDTSRQAIDLGLGLAKTKL
jgi:2-oxoglutarate ferredoxin oxidoreductase subunit gamma